MEDQAMSSTTQTNVRHVGTAAGHGLLGRLGGGLRAAFDAYMRHRERRAVEADLRKMLEERLKSAE